MLLLSSIVFAICLIPIAILAVNGGALRTTQPCSNLYTVISGDTCIEIAKRNKLSLANLYALNPTLNKNSCSMLSIGQQVCIGSLIVTSTTFIPKPTLQSCAKSHTVIKGDICYSIAKANNIPLSDFYTFNQGINCNDLPIGQEVCLDSSQASTNTKSPSKTAIVIYK